MKVVDFINDWLLSHLVIVSLAAAAGSLTSYRGRIGEGNRRLGTFLGVVTAVSVPLVVTYNFVNDPKVWENLVGLTTLSALGLTSGLISWHIRRWSSPMVKTTR